MKPWPGTKIFCLESTSFGDIPTLKCLEAVFQLLLKNIVALAVLVLFVMLVIGGFKYLTSAGDQKKTASAQQTMTYAIAGIVLMVLAYAIFQIIHAFTGVDILKFEIPNYPSQP